MAVAAKLVITVVVVLLLALLAVIILGLIGGDMDESSLRSAARVAGAVRGPEL